MSDQQGPVVLTMLPDAGEFRMDSLIGRMPTIGIYYLATSLEKAGYSVETINRQYDAVNPLTIASKINSYQPCLVGFTLYDRTLPTAEKTINLLRLVYKGPIVVGGYTPTFHAEDLLRRWPQLDYVILREGEHAVVALMEHLQGERPVEEVPNLVYRNGSEVRFNPPQSLVDVNQVPWPRREWSDKDDVTPIISRRGCMSRCSFCSMVPFYDTSLGPIVRRRDAGQVVDEIEYCIEEGGAQHFMFYDDDFGLSAKFDREWCQELLAKVRSRGLKFCWGVELRVADVIRGASLLPEMHELGLTHCSLGMESLLPRQLKLYNKGYKQEHVFEAVDILNELAIDYQTNVIFWDPWITLDEAARHVALMEQIEAADQLGSANFPLFSNKLIPRKGTKVFKMLEDSNMLLTRPGEFCNFSFDFVDGKVQEFFTATSVPFNDNLRTNQRPPALWLHVPQIEHSGHVDLGRSLRRFGREIAHLDFAYFKKLLHTAIELGELESESSRRALDEIHDEFGPLISQCLEQVPSEMLPKPRATAATVPSRAG